VQTATETTRTVADDLAALALTRGPIAQRALADLQGPPFPPGTGLAWDTFLVLHGRRTSGAHAVNPITPEALQAHCALVDLQLTPCEVLCVYAADDAFLEVVADRLRARTREEPS
jgi:hypothetical protein